WTTRNVAIAFSDATTLACATGWVDPAYRRWDVATGKELLRTALPVTGNVHAVALSRDGRLVTVAPSDGTVRVYDGASGQEARRGARGEAMPALVPRRCRHGRPAGRRRRRRQRRRTRLPVRRGPGPPLARSGGPAGEGDRSPVHAGRQAGARVRGRRPPLGGG